MPPARRTATSVPVTPFSDRLVLNRWLLSLLGVTEFDELAAILRDESLEGLDADNIHHFHHRLVAELADKATLSGSELLEYDQNIVGHTQRLNARRITRGDQPIVWKYFQYITLLFTEIYLDRYFSDADRLRNDINGSIAAFNDGVPAADRITLLDAGPDAKALLNKVSFLMATGSGKTLVMHANLLQYLAHAEKHGRRRDLNRIILLTPNEGLSKQHLAEFEAAGVDAEIFDKESQGLFTGRSVEIVEITRLRDDMGERTVAVDAFEGSNLVLVDEGHRGASGGGDGAWMRFRNVLCEKGFSFEYSATFTQAVKGNPKLADLYAKNILVDYSYRFFYLDGFGKDYRILNLGESTDEHRELYLTACLLSFFQQQWLFSQHEQDFRDFLIEEPLWVFVGSRVTAGLASHDATDIVEILLFLSRYITDRDASIRHIRRLMEEGLSNAAGQNIFAQRFDGLVASSLSPESVFDRSLSLVFNAPAGGTLYVEHLRGTSGEIALRAGAENEPFGVINVGDAPKLVRLCAEAGIAAEDREFSGSLFRQIDRSHSTVKLLIGSKKFTEGWSSWRVSTMTLMNVGRGEGAQIIQLFGRGVRLKGYGMSLKRSSRAQLPAGVEPPRHILDLETLGVFGIRANYMAQFRDFLADEGLNPDAHRVEVFLPVINHLGTTKLKTIGLKPEIMGVSTGAVDAFRKLGPRPYVGAPDPHFHSHPITLNWYPKIEAMRSGASGENEVHAARNVEHLNPRHLSLLDFDYLYFEAERFRTERGWHNMNLSRTGVRDLLHDHSWYRVLIPEDEMALDSFDRVRLWSDIAVALVKKYMERIYAFRRRQWEMMHLEYRVLDSADANFLRVRESAASGYTIRIDASRHALIGQIEALKTAIERGEIRSLIQPDFKAIAAPQHLYEPLLSVKSDSIEVTPASLNPGELRFVEDLREFAEANAPLLAGRQLFLLRNLSRGRGIGFIEADNFHPDFILWIVTGGTQHIMFVDPKGIRNHHPDDAKIAFHKTVKEIEARLGDASVRLSSFIVSNTRASVMEREWSPLTKADMEARNIVFQGDDRDTYIGQILASTGLG